MKIYAATEGSEEGLDIFRAWSERNPADGNEDSCEARWEHWHRSPPTRCGAGSIVHMARQALPGWRKPSAGPNDGSEFGPGEEMPVDPDAWKSMLRRGRATKNEEGAIKGDLANAATAFQHAPKWRDRRRWNDFSSQLDLDGRPIQDDDFRRVRSGRSKRACP